jgi:hypothetical protein
MQYLRPIMMLGILCRQNSLFELVAVRHPTHAAIKIQRQFFALRRPLLCFVLLLPRQRLWAGRP